MRFAVADKFQLLLLTANTYPWRLWSQKPLFHVFSGFLDECDTSWSLSLKPDTDGNTRHHVIRPGCCPLTQTPVT